MQFFIKKLFLVILKFIILITEISKMKKLDFCVENINFLFIL